MAVVNSRHQQTRSEQKGIANERRDVNFGINARRGAFVSHMGLWASFVGKNRRAAPARLFKTDKGKKAIFRDCRFRGGPDTKVSAGNPSAMSFANNMLFGNLVLAALDEGDRRVSCRDSETKRQMAPWVPSSEKRRAKVKRSGNFGKKIAASTANKDESLEYIKTVPAPYELC
ncbi:hypothetical protein EVAR_79840_1 [Eumeta japonica]|uniref:Uncharacterized protein n=1 Tax=Eumeta variegata TaxID=151549 RepID=A0A4C1TYT9_EUMVA|nr:hypothetical protein EVAR_79840_1 [Eumeta japonica]